MFSIFCCRDWIVVLKNGQFGYSMVLVVSRNNQMFLCSLNGIGGGFISLFMGDYMNIGIVKVRVIRKWWFMLCVVVCRLLLWFMFVWVLWFLVFVVLLLWLVWVLVGCFVVNFCLCLVCVVWVCVFVVGLVLGIGVLYWKLQLWIVVVIVFVDRWVGLQDICRVVVVKFVLVVLILGSVVMVFFSVCVQLVFIMLLMGQVCVCIVGLWMCVIGFFFGMEWGCVGVVG